MAADNGSLASPVELTGSLVLWRYRERVDNRFWFVRNKTVVYDKGVLEAGFERFEAGEC